MEVYRNFIIDGGADPLVFRELVLTLARQVRAANLHIHHHLHLLTQKHWCSLFASDQVTVRDSPLKNLPQQPDGRPQSPRSAVSSTVNMHALPVRIFVIRRSYICVWMNVIIFKSCGSLFFYRRSVHNLTLLFRRRRRKLPPSRRRMLWMRPPPLPQKRKRRRLPLLRSRERRVRATLLPLLRKRPPPRRRHLCVAHIKFVFAIFYYSQIYSPGVSW